MSLKQSIYVFTDLDDSLFQTRRKCANASSLFNAALDRKGQPLSYFTQPQKHLLALLEQGTLIPVTGRNMAALERVHLAFPSYRITSHGAMVSGADGNPDAEWLELIRHQLEVWAEHMEIAVARLSRMITRDGLALRCRLIEDHGIPVYVSIKGDEPAVLDLTGKIQEIWREEQAQVHHNGQNMALLPPFANKERAVDFLMRRLKGGDANPLFIGIGDSVTDLPFMRLCHYAIMPRRSQLMETIWV